MGSRNKRQGVKKSGGAKASASVGKPALGKKAANDRDEDKRAETKRRLTLKRLERLRDKGGMELVDLCQLAELYSSFGQTDKAIQVYQKEVLTKEASKEQHGALLVAKARCALCLVDRERADEARALLEGCEELLPAADLQAILSDVAGDDKGAVLPDPAEQPAEYFRTWFERHLLSRSTTKPNEQKQALASTGTTTSTVFAQILSSSGAGSVRSGRVSSELLAATAAAWLYVGILYISECLLGESDSEDDEDEEEAVPPSVAGEAPKSDSSNDVDNCDTEDAAVNRKKKTASKNKWNLFAAVQRAFLVNPFVGEALQALAQIYVAENEEEAATSAPFASILLSEGFISKVQSAEDDSSSTGTATGTAAKETNTKNSNGTTPKYSVAHMEAALIFLSGWDALSIFRDIDDLHLFLMKALPRLVVAGNQKDEKKKNDGKAVRTGASSTTASTTAARPASSSTGAAPKGDDATSDDESEMSDGEFFDSIDAPLEIDLGNLDKLKSLSRQELVSAWSAERTKLTELRYVLKSRAEEGGEQEGEGEEEEYSEGSSMEDIEDDMEEMESGSEEEEGVADEDSLMRRMMMEEENDD